MDISLLDVLPPSPLFDDRVDDVLAANAAFIMDPFTASPSLADDCCLAPPRTQLLLDPFDSPPIPLASAAPFLPSPLSPSPLSPSPLSPAACLHPFMSAADAAVISDPMPTSPSLQQENLPANNCPAPPRPSASSTRAPAQRRLNAAVVPSAAANSAAANGPSAAVAVAAVAAAVSAEQRSKDKLAQRKLRNKESARRYREKQVARRRQLENYTRTLSEQNRELEVLHHKLLTLTCQRSMRSGAPLSDVAARVL
ncbi:unnamed protein product [Agarophyton chilense]